MPEAYRCSRCGGFYSGRPEFGISLELFEENVELCPSCVEEFKAWMEFNESKTLSDYEQEDLE